MVMGGLSFALGDLKTRVILGRRFGCQSLRSILKEFIDIVRVLKIVGRRIISLFFIKISMSMEIGSPRLLGLVMNVLDVFTLHGNNVTFITFF